jgi:hypothetical protein
MLYLRLYLIAGGNLSEILQINRQEHIFMYPMRADYLSETLLPSWLRNNPYYLASTVYGENLHRVCTECSMLYSPNPIGDQHLRRKSIKLGSPCFISELIISHSPRLRFII